MWAFKHTMRDIADMGLSICLEFINNFANSDPVTANQFYQIYFLNLLNDIFFVLTDNNHKSGTGNDILLLSTKGRMFCPRTECETHWSIMF